MFSWRAPGEESIMWKMLERLRCRYKWNGKVNSNGAAIRRVCARVCLHSRDAPSSRYAWGSFAFGETDKNARSLLTHTHKHRRWLRIKRRNRFICFFSNRRTRPTVFCLSSYISIRPSFGSSIPNAFCAHTHDWLTILCIWIESGAFIGFSVFLSSRFQSEYRMITRARLMMIFWCELMIAPFIVTSASIRTHGRRKRCDTISVFAAFRCRARPENHSFFPSLLSNDFAQAQWKWKIIRHPIIISVISTFTSRSHLMVGCRLRTSIQFGSQTLGHLHSSALLHLFAVRMKTRERVHIISIRIFREEMTATDKIHQENQQQQDENVSLNDTWNLIGREEEREREDERRKMKTKRSLLVLRSNPFARCSSRGQGRWRGIQMEPFILFLLYFSSNNFIFFSFRLSLRIHQVEMTKLEHCMKS